MQIQAEGENNDKSIDTLPPSALESFLRERIAIANVQRRLQLARKRAAKGTPVGLTHEAFGQHDVEEKPCIIGDDYELGAESESSSDSSQEFYARQHIGAASEASETLGDIGSLCTFCGDIFPSAWSKRRKEYVQRLFSGLHADSTGDISCEN